MDSFMEVLLLSSIDNTAQIGISMTDGLTLKTLLILHQQLNLQGLASGLVL
jgi:hypothetical protein